jgi:hypothetical protein
MPENGNRDDMTSSVAGVPAINVSSIESLPSHKNAIAAVKPDVFSGHSSTAAAPHTLHCKAPKP